MNLTPVTEMTETNIIHPVPYAGQIRSCLACGTNKIKAGRRYCTKDCRQQMLWVLSLSKGLLKAFNARYAAFSFNKSYIILDVLPIWAKEISRFSCKRSSGKKPADDLKRLILQSGKEWYHMINHKSSRSYASLFLLKRNNNERIAPESIKPNTKRRPKFSKIERESIKILQLKVEEVLSEGHVYRIKSAYKNLAKIYHPDVGGDAEIFKKLNEAHHQLLLWADNPQFTSRKALMNSWSYDGSINRWTPPL
ncbi:MAG: J domain-containing protein [Pseudomonadota bacterium]